VFCTQAAFWQTLGVHSAARLQQPGVAAAVKPQVLLAQVRTWHAFPEGQGMLQPPQCETMLVVSVSQPSSAVGAFGRTQLPRPGWQGETHSPAAQESALVPVEAQARPQPPQLALELLRSLSQPSLRLSLLQSPKPPAHRPLQLPPLHEGVMLAVEQAMPQPPQWLGFRLVLVSQPTVLGGVVLQSPRPATQPV
jgi:hypothetical protein